MDTDSGTFFQFQNDESRKKMEELLGRPLLQVEGMPNKNCTLCGGDGAVQSKVTMKWIPCRCTDLLSKLNELENGLQPQLPKEE